MFGPPVTTLLISWAAITVVLAILLAYRTLIGMKEDDQLFLDPAESSLESEQRQLLTKLARVSPSKNCALQDSRIAAGCRLIPDPFAELGNQNTQFSTGEVRCDAPLRSHPR